MMMMMMAVAMLTVVMLDEEAVAVVAVVGAHLGYVKLRDADNSTPHDKRSVARDVLERNGRIVVSLESLQVGRREHPIACARRRRCRRCSRHRAVVLLIPVGTRARVHAPHA